MDNTDYDKYDCVADAEGVIDALEAENERLRDLLQKAAAELRDYIHYKNDMDIVYEIEDAIDAAKEKQHD